MGDLWKLQHFVTCQNLRFRLLQYNGRVNLVFFGVWRTTSSSLSVSRCPHYQTVTSFLVKSTSEYEISASPQCFQVKQHTYAVNQTAEKGELPTISDTSFLNKDLRETLKEHLTPFQSEPFHPENVNNEDLTCETCLRTSTKVYDLKVKCYSKSARRSKTRQFGQSLKSTCNWKLCLNCFHYLTEDQVDLKYSWPSILCS